MNPNYDNDKLGLEMLTFDEPDLSYEFNTLCFWRDPETGSVYTATSSGCSCPVPFEEYEGEDKAAVLQKLERVGSLEQALSCFDSWNKDYSGRPLLTIDSRKELQDWYARNVNPTTP